MVIPCRTGVVVLKLRVESAHWQAGKSRYIKNWLAVLAAALLFHLTVRHRMSEEPRTVEIFLPREISLQTFTMTFACDTHGPVVRIQQPYRFA